MILSNHHRESELCASDLRANALESTCSIVKEIQWKDIVRNIGIVDLTDRYLYQWLVMMLE